jgi:hypothetical protein
MCVGMGGAEGRGEVIDGRDAIMCAGMGGAEGRDELIDGRDDITRMGGAEGRGWELACTRFAAALVTACWYNANADAAGAAAVPRRGFFTGYEARNVDG